MSGKRSLRNLGIIVIAGGSTRRCVSAAGLGVRPGVKAAVSATIRAKKKARIMARVEEEGRVVCGRRTTANVGQKRGAIPSPAQPVRW
tara:strand:- start:215 stop:478 length:264 start_codon:yes stop_codon:yes gene_type:complete